MDLLNLEIKLKEHPDIFAAHVIAVPQTNQEEILFAWIVPVTNSDISQEEIRKYCINQLPNDLVPQYFKIVEELPMTPSGKVKKLTLQQMSEELIEND